MSKRRIRFTSPDHAARWAGYHRDYVERQRQALKAIDGVDYTRDQLYHPHGACIHGMSAAHTKVTEIWLEEQPGMSVLAAEDRLKEAENRMMRGRPRSGDFSTLIKAGRMVPGITMGVKKGPGSKS